VKTNVSPKANFTYKPGSPIVKETITFNDLSIDLDGYIVNWTWNFDDGNISYKQNTTHSYEKKGIYNVTLTVIDNDGGNDIYSLKITIKEKEGGPGFEFAFLIIAIAIILFKRRNNKN
jgi:PKD repeat protein